MGAATSRESLITHGARSIKKSDGILRQGIDVRYQFIATEKAKYPVTLMSRILKVSRSGFHAWHKRAESVRSCSDRALVVDIKAAHRASRDIYGSPRVHRE
jgi:putative transposase